jgi:hypothetical protein
MGQSWNRELGRASRAPSRKVLKETTEISHVEHRRCAGVVAVGVAVAGGELLEEAGEIGDVEDGSGGALVAVGVAGDRLGAGGADHQRQGSIDETELQGNLAGLVHP